MRFIAGLLILFLFSCNSIQKVDSIIFNGKIYTVDSNFSFAESMAIKDGKIVAIGSNDSILKFFSSDSMMDAKGNFVYPGFIDAHAHFVGYGQSLYQVDLFGCKSWEEVVEKVHQFSMKYPNELWIRGRGWDQNKWINKTFPTNELLNQNFPKTPILLTRVDGHAAIANNKALELARIEPNQQIIGGEIETKQGKLTGVLIDNAVDLVTSILPKPIKKDYEKWLLTAQNKCFEKGLTTITDCGLSANDVEKIDALQQEDKLQMRLYVMLSDEPNNYKAYLTKGPYKTDKLFVNGFKIYADGALGSRGACLLKHYADKPNWQGFLLSNPEHFDSIAAVLINSPFQMCTHAIGDSANRAMLKIYEKYLQGKNDKRWRIEHAQVVNEADFNLFGKNNIVPSVQPTHATSDMYWANERLGNERIKGAYAYKQLLQQNGWLPLGTDFPVEDIDPFKTFLAAVIRKDAQQFPANGFQVENALSREETIKGMTIWAAKAGFLEKEIGSLELGKKADFILLDKDLMKVSATDILKTKVISTYIGGKKVY